MKKLLIALLTILSLSTSLTSAAAFDGNVMRRAAAAASAPASSAPTNNDNTTVYVKTLGDQGNTGHEITVKGTPKIKSFNAEGNSIVNYSGFFNGVDAYLTIPDHADWPNFGTDVWAIEVTSFIVGDGTGSITVFGQSRGNADSTDLIECMIFEKNHGTLSGAVRFKYKIAAGTTQYLTTATGLYKYDQWNHVAYTYDGANTLKIYVNGTLALTNTDVKAAITLSSDVHIGVTPYNRSVGIYRGYMAGLAVHKALVYTTDFTPPKTLAEMTNDANTVLFIPFTDLSQGETPATIDSTAVGESIAHTVTNVSSKVSGCTFWWDGAWGSNTGTEYLTAPHHTDWDFGTGGFVFRSKYNFKDLTARMLFLCPLDANNRFYLYFGGTYFLYRNYTAGVNTQQLLVTVTPVANKLYDIELNRTSGQLRLFLDGVQQGATTANTVDLTPISGEFMVYTGNGFVGEAILKNSGGHTTTFTPTSSKEVSDANTKLLIHPSGNTAIGSTENHDIEFTDGLILSTDVPSATSFTNSWAYDGGDINTISPADSVDFDINSTNANLIFWVKLNTHAATSTMLTQYQSSTDFWAAENVHGTGLRFNVHSGGTDIVTLAGAEIDDSQWYQYILAKVGDDYGLYKALEGDSVATQVAFVTDSDTATNTGPLLMGGKTTSTDTIDGNLIGPILYNSNELGAAPNVGLTDTIPVVTAPLQ